MARITTRWGRQPSNLSSGPEATSSGTTSPVLAACRRMVCTVPMALSLRTPSVEELPAIVESLGAWQDDRFPVQLHPGDVGWFWRFGDRHTASALRTWSDAGQTVAVGLLDEPNVLRLAVAPDRQQDAVLAARLADDIVAPQRGVLPESAVEAELPRGSAIRRLLIDEGWTEGAGWTSLRHRLGRLGRLEVPDQVRIEVVGAARIEDRVAVQRSAFDRSTFTAERWRAMAAGTPYRAAQCLLAFDGDDNPVAAVTVWSAGPGRPGLLEPMGVHREHRGRGYGRAICVAAACALQGMGCSSALVCTRSENRAAVRTYAAAGFEPNPEIRDVCRGPAVVAQ